MSKLRINDLESLDTGASVGVDVLAGIPEELNRRVIYVDTIADLQALPTSELVNGQEFFVRSVDRVYKWDGNGFGIAYDLFLIYGQSNASGQATSPGDTSRPNNYPDNLDDSLALYWDKDSESIVPVVYNMRHVSGETARGHAWAAFANSHAKMTGRGCIFLPAAQGGQSISSLSKGGPYYNYIVQEYPKLSSEIQSQGIKIESKSLLFHQGETDQLQEVSRAGYQIALNDLWHDIRQDFSISRAFVALVGSPQTREERTIEPIRAAQEYVCTSLTDVFMGFSGFSGFTINNGLLRDGVHATQSGYNLMGEELAKSVSDVLISELTSTKNAQERYGIINAPGDQIWRQVSATFVFNPSTEQWELQDKSNGLFRLSCVGGAESVPSPADRLRIHLTTRASAALGFSLSMNNAMLGSGVTSLTCDLRDDLPSGSFQGDGYALEVRIRQDLSFIVSGLGDIRAYANVSSTLPRWLSGVSASVEADGSVTLSHPFSSRPPIVTQLANDSFTNSSFVSFGDGIRSNTQLSYKVDGGNTDCVVMVPSATINPTHAGDNWAFTVSGVIAEARY